MQHHLYTNSHNLKPRKHTLCHANTTLLNSPTRCHKTSRCAITNFDNTKGALTQLYFAQHAVALTQLCQCYICQYISTLKLTKRSVGNCHGPQSQETSLNGSRTRACQRRWSVLSRNLAVLINGTKPNGNTTPACFRSNKTLHNSPWRLHNFAQYITDSPSRYHTITPLIAFTK